MGGSIVKLKKRSPELGGLLTEVIALSTLDAHYRYSLPLDETLHYNTGQDTYTGYGAGIRDTGQAPRAGTAGEAGRHSRRAHPQHAAKFRAGELISCGQYAGTEWGGQGWGASGVRGQTARHHPRTWGGQ